jgi:hypothetical protein
VRDARYRYIRNFTPDRPFLQKNDYKERSYPVWNLLKELHAQGRLTPAQDFLCQPTMQSEELYDLESDPHEIKNLASSEIPEHQSAVATTPWRLGKVDRRNGRSRPSLRAAEVAAAEGATNRMRRREQGEWEQVVRRLLECGRMLPHSTAIAARQADRIRPGRREPDR